MQPILVTTSCEKQQDAERIARLALEKRLAACVQISSPVVSSYWWNGARATETEYLVVLKSERSLFETLAREIKTIHPYDVPEIIATEICLVDEDYRSWLSQELNL